MISNIYIELPAEEQLRIAKLTCELQEKLIAEAQGKDTSNVVINLLVDITKMVEKYEAEKWFTAERNKNTTNELILEYSTQIEQLKKQIR